MKLVDILVRELKQWPESWKACAQESNGLVAGFSREDLVHGENNGWEGRIGPGSAYIPLSRGVISEQPIACDQRTAVITRAQWKAAVDVLKAEKDQKMDIDWSKAPEGATAWDCRPHADKTWMRRNWRPNRGWDYWGMSHWIYYGEIPEEQERQMIHRPPQQPWSGEGLPPAGVEFEFTTNSGYNWHRGSMLFSDSQVVLLNGYQLFKIEDPDLAFRPVRTPEQIAAEERQKQIKEMQHDLPEWILKGDYGHIETICTMLHEKGYRKFEIVDKDDGEGEV